MADEKITGNQALTMVVRASQQANIRLVDVVTWLVAEHERPGPSPPGSHASRRPHWPLLAIRTPRTRMNDVGVDAVSPSQDTQQQLLREHEPLTSWQENTAMAVSEPCAFRAIPGAELVFTRGAQIGTRVAVASSLTIGRACDCDILLEDATISRHHAELYHDEQEHYTLVDTGSLNGIFLNRHPVTQRAELADGDEIWIGKARFAFHLTLAASPLPETASH